MNGETARKLEEIFRVVFSVPETSDVTQLKNTTERRWDSLAHVSLVVAIESEFNVTIDAADSLRLTSYETTRQLLEEMGV